jgi:CBS domain-containing protein
MSGSNDDIERDRPVARWMSRPVQWVPADAQLELARRRLELLGVSCLAVLDAKGRVIGVLSRSDLLRVGRPAAGATGKIVHLPDAEVHTVMSRPVVTVAPDDPLERAAVRMVACRVHRVFVTDGDRLVGVFSTRDAMGALARLRPITPIAEFMSSPVVTVDAADPVSSVLARRDAAGISGVVVVEGEWPVGVFTDREALAVRDLPDSTRVEDVMSPALLCLKASTPLHRASAQAAATRARRVVVVEGHHMVGMLTGMDFTRALLRE